MFYKTLLLLSLTTFNSFAIFLADDVSDSLIGEDSPEEQQKVPSASQSNNPNTTLLEVVQKNEQEVEIPIDKKASLEQMLKKLLPKESEESLQTLCDSLTESQLDILTGGLLWLELNSKTSNSIPFTAKALDICNTIGLIAFTGGACFGVAFITTVLIWVISDGAGEDSCETVYCPNGWKMVFSNTNEASCVEIGTDYNCAQYGIHEFGWDAPNELVYLIQCLTEKNISLRDLPIPSFFADTMKSHCYWVFKDLTIGFLSGFGGLTALCASCFAVSAYSDVLFKIINSFLTKKENQKEKNLPNFNCSETNFAEIDKKLHSYPKILSQWQEFQALLNSQK